MDARDVAALALAIVSLAAGPILFWLLRRSRTAIGVIEGFVLGAVGGLVLLHVLPRVLPVAGAVALAAFAIGLLLPSWFHKFSLSAEGWVAALGLLGLATHSALDGAGIAHGDDALTLAIVLHRAPAGVFVWWWVHPRYGLRAAVVAMLLIAVATVLGFAFVADAGLADAKGLAVFEAFVGGALLHVLVGHPMSRAETSNGAELVGPIAGAALAVALLHGHHGHEGHGGALFAYADRLRSLIYAVSPALVVGFAVAGLLAVTKLHERTASLRGLTVESIAVSIPLLGLELAAARVVAGVVASLALLRFLGAARSRAQGAFAMIDQSLPWLLVGLACAALVDPGAPSSTLTAANPMVVVLAFAALALPLNIGGAAAAPIAAAIAWSGGSAGAAVAFFIAGAAINTSALTTDRGRAALGSATVFGIAAATGLGVDAIGLTLPPIAGDGGPLALGSMIILGVVLLASMFRRGPRGFLLGLASEPAEDALRI